MSDERSEISNFRDVSESGIAAGGPLVKNEEFKDVSEHGNQARLKKPGKTIQFTAGDTHKIKLDFHEAGVSIFVNGRQVAQDEIEVLWPPIPDQQAKPSAPAE